MGHSSKKVDTPRSKARKLLTHGNMETVRKTLVFGNVLAMTLKQKYCNSTEKNKFLIKNLCWSKAISKYRIKKMLHEHIGLSIRKNDLQTRRKTKTTSIVGKIKKQVSAFLTRDDNSRITTSKADTVTKSKEKKQRRVLLDSLKNLHEKYKAEYNCGISYSFFCKLKPFEVTHPKARDRKTCLCQVCENAELMLLQIKHHKILPASVTLSAAVEQSQVVPANQDSQAEVNFLNTFTFIYLIYSRLSLIRFEQ